MSNPAAPFYCVFVVFWGVCMLEYWKRREAYVALEQGMTDFERNEPYRPEFQGYESLKLTGEDVFYFDIKKKRKIMCTSFTVVGFLCLLVIATTAAV